MREVGTSPASASSSLGRPEPVPCLSLPVVFCLCQDTTPFLGLSPGLECPLPSSPPAQKKAQLRDLEEGEAELGLGAWRSLQPEREWRRTRGQKPRDPHLSFLTSTMTAWTGRFLGPFLLLRVNLSPSDSLSKSPPKALPWPQERGCVPSP